MHSVFNQIKNTFAAMHFAEEGDLDAVKQIFQDNPSISEEEVSSEAVVQHPAIPAY